MGGLGRVGHFHDVTGGQFVDALQYGQPFAHMPVAQQLRDGPPVDGAAAGGMGLHGRQFRAEQKHGLARMALPTVVEGLFAQPVAGQHQAAVLAVPDGKGKHARAAP